MTTETLTLTEFLLARLAEDEAHLTAPPFNDFPPSDDLTPDGVCWKVVPPDRVCIRARGHQGDPKRVLADVEAKRRIISTLSAWCPEPTPPPRGETAERTAWRMLVNLAAVYSDHWDYRPEWSD